MKLQVFSDLYLEKLQMSKLWWNEYNIDCDILCLVGNIGSPWATTYWSFIKYASTRAKYVLLIMGQQECWGSSESNTYFKITEKCKEFKNVIFLQKNMFTYEDYVFLGCTLWSHIPNKYYNEYSLLPEFKNIRHSMPIIWSLNYHETDKKWLEDSLKEVKSKQLKTIVLTSNGPLDPDYFKESNSNYLLSSDMKNLYENVDIWCYGKAHSANISHSYKLAQNKTLFVTNQQESLDKTHNDFDKSFRLDI